MGLFGSIAGQAAGSLISAGVSKLFGGEKRGPSISDQLGWQQASYDNMFQAQMDNADKYGIHRLAMLGVPVAGGSTFEFGGQPASSGKTQAIHDMGQGVSRAISAYASKGERDLAETSARLQVENQQLQNDRLRSEIALMNSPGTPPELPLQGPITPFRDIQWPSGRKTLGWTSEMGQMLENDPFLLLEAQGQKLSELGINDLKKLLSKYIRPKTRRHSGGRWFGGPAK